MLSLGDSCGWRSSSCQQGPLRSLLSLDSLEASPLALRARCFEGACPMGRSLKNCGGKWSRPFIHQEETRRWVFAPDCMASCRRRVDGKTLPQASLSVSMWVSLAGPLRRGLLAAGSLSEVRAPCVAVRCVPVVGGGMAGAPCCH